MFLSRPDPIGNCMLKDIDNNIETFVEYIQV